MNASAVGALVHQHSPFAAALAHGVLPFGLNILLEQVEVHARLHPAGGLDVVVQAAWAGSQRKSDAATEWPAALGCVHHKGRTGCTMRAGHHSMGQASG